MSLLGGITPLTLKKSLEDGFNKGFEISNKLTKKDIKIDPPTSNEKTYGNH